MVGCRNFGPRGRAEGEAWGWRFAGWRLGGGLVVGVVVDLVKGEEGRMVG